MQYWILKGNRNHPDFDNDFERMIRRGSTDRWFSSKLLNAIQTDDRLFVYEGSPKFEVWGLARYVRRDGPGTFLVEYLTDALTSRVQRDRDGIARNELFEGATFLKAGPVQTIYRIEHEQADWLYRTVLKKQPDVRGTWPDLEEGAPSQIGRPAQNLRSEISQSREKAASPADGNAGIFRAISIRQPYVELILRGTKREEFRSRPTRIRERVWLYAGLNPGDDESWEEIGLSPGTLPRGQIVGTVEIVDCQPFDDGYAYSLRSPKRLSAALRPINQPQPGFWRPQF